jgi:hypothetical protein
MKALDDMGEDSAGGEDTEAVASVLDTLVDETAANNDDDDDEENNDDDDAGLASRITKRSTNTENDAHQMKRLRSSPTALMNSV